jgi:protein-tyrosine phosphatase
VSDQLTFVDIHCHMLPGLDDGADSWEESLAMARLAVADGFSTVITTPHQLGNHASNDGDTIRLQARRFQEYLDANRVPLTILPGADVRIEPDLVRKLRDGSVLTLADRRRYVLLELPHELYVPLDRLLGELNSVGMVGILSHPERNQGILNRPQLIGPLVDAGCLMQVTAGSLTGSFGPEIMRFSQWMLSEGLVHFLATDAHGSESRRPLIYDAFRRTEELVGDEAAYDICCRNPSCVAADLEIQPGRRRIRRTGLASWFPWRKAG